MRTSPPRLLLAVTLSTVAACAFNETGLDPRAGRVDVVTPDDGASGVGGLAGQGGTSAIAASSGSAGVRPVGGSGGSIGGAGGAAGAPGSADDAAAGATGAGGDDHAAGDDGAAGDGSSGQADAPGATDGGGAAESGPPISVVGCSDGTREGLRTLTKFPDVAACAGAWTVPGLVAPETLTPQCDRGAGNDGVHPDGNGCSVADLCAEGWHVCESAHEFAARASSCDEAFPGGAVKMFFATRQRGPMTTCDPANETGTNNVYGCGNFGSNAMSACAPFMRMLRDYDCKNNPPWTCVDGPINYSTSELLDVTKPGSDHGGVLCCR